MPEAESKPVVPVAVGIPLKMVIIIAAGIFVFGLGGAFALFKLTAGGHGEADQKAEATVAKGEGHGEKEAKHGAGKTGSRPRC